MGGEGDGGGSEGYYTRSACATLVRALPCCLHHIAQLLVNPHPWEHPVQVYISNFRYTGCVKNAAFDLIRTESDPPKWTFFNVFA